MLNAVAGKRDSRAIPEAQRDGDHRRALRVAEAHHDLVSDIGLLQRRFHLRHRHLVERRLPLESLSRFCSCVRRRHRVRHYYGYTPRARVASRTRPTASEYAAMRKLIPLVSE